MMPDSTPAAKTTYSRWVLPDDGIIDPIAVEIAASGHRMVRLTRAKRRAVAARNPGQGRHRHDHRHPAAHAVHRDPRAGRQHHRRNRRSCW